MMQNLPGYLGPRLVYEQAGASAKVSIGIFVGRGIYESPNPAAEAERYRQIGWSAYQER